MKQLAQQLKSGKIEILEVPFPSLGKGKILVKKYYSVIGAGTERQMVSEVHKGYIANSKIESAFAQTMDSSSSIQNTVNINLKFSSGSIANISYFSNGNKMMPKELIEVLSNDMSIVIDDFKNITIYGKNIKKIKYKGQDKGHGQELTEYFNATRNRTSCPIPFEESYHSTLATFKVMQSIQEKRSILI